MREERKGVIVREEGIKGPIEGHRGVNQRNTYIFVHFKIYFDFSNNV